MYIENGREKLSKIIDNPENWFETHKTLYSIQMRREEKGVNVHNFLEGNDYVVSDAKSIVFTGTEGEEWVVGDKKPMTDYRLDVEGTLITPEYLQTLGTEPVTIWTIDPAKEEVPKYFALQLPRDISIDITTDWGEVLRVNKEGIDHGSGDYLICQVKDDGTPDIDNMWSVNGRIFDRTYDKTNEKYIEGFTTKEPVKNDVVDSSKAKEDDGAGLD